MSVKTVLKQCRNLEVNDHTYIECDSPVQAVNVSKKMVNSVKLTGEFKGRKFSCNRFTGIGMKQDILFLVRVTRIE